MGGIYGVLRPRAEATPDKLALISELDGTRTYAELLVGAQRAGHVYEH